MKILQNRTVSVISALFFKPGGGGANVTLRHERGASFKKGWATML